MADQSQRSQRDPSIGFFLSDGLPVIPPSYFYQSIAAVDVLIRILKSDRLAMYHENTTFTLVHYWLESREGWTIEDKHKAFHTILESDVLRFHHMDMDYLAVYAFRTPWMQGLDRGVSDIMLHCAVYKRMGCRWNQGVKLSDSRSQKGKTCHDLVANVPWTVCAVLTDGAWASCFIGLVRGLPIYIEIGKRLHGDGVRNFGVFVGWSSGGLPISGQYSQGISSPAVNMTMHLKGEPDVIYTPKVRETSMALEEDAPWDGSLPLPLGGKIWLPVVLDLLGV